MVRIFYGREDEIRFLDDEFQKDRKSLIVVYGRRRVGKTELIKRFIRNHDHIYFLVSQEPSDMQMNRLISQIANSLDERTPKIDDWNEAIEYIGEKLNEKRIILAIDEFPYLIESNKSIPSYFQKLIDEYLSDSKSMIIISGSSIGMIESEVLGYKSPLYGRRTGQIDLQPFDFENSCLFIQKKIEETINAYAIFGNIAMYLSFFENQKDLRENILDNILNKNSFLNKEPEFILKQELREPSKYLSILYAIANGNTRLNEISNKIGIMPGTLSKYMEQLLKLRLIKKDIPVTERNKKSKKSIYLISDNLFRFWFRFIEPNLSDVEDNPSDFLDSIIMPQLSSYAADTFEEICREFIKKEYPYGVVGRWWHKDNEIDIVGIDANKKIMLCGECKWKEKVDGIKVLESLKKKSEGLKYHGRKEYIIFAKSFSRKNNEATYCSLKELEKFFRRK